MTDTMQDEVLRRLVGENPPSYVWIYRAVRNDGILVGVVTPDASILYATVKPVDVEHRAEGFHTKTAPCQVTFEQAHKLAKDAGRSKLCIYDVTVKDGQYSERLVKEVYVR